VRVAAKSSTAVSIAFGLKNASKASKTLLNYFKNFERHINCNIIQVMKILL